MQWLTLFVLTAAVCSGGGVTKPSGIEQFWTDDYKIFEQVYGKTSDREIYGATLPPNIGFDTKNIQASEKKERYINFQTNSDEIEDIDIYSFGNKQNIPKAKKEKPTFNFISYNDFKPISESTDPDTYNYLKHLEELEKEKNKKIPKGVSALKPYLDPYVSKYQDSYSPNPEDTDAYKSIQEILDAHEANKGQDDDASSKYLTYREKTKPTKTKKPPRVTRKSKPRCLPGRCRKRSTSYRSRPRPYYVKKRVVIS